MIFNKVMLKVVEAVSEYEFEADYDTPVDIWSYKKVSRRLLVSLFGQYFVLSHNVIITETTNLYPEYGHLAMLVPASVNVRVEVDVMNSKALAELPKEELYKIVSSDTEDVEISLSLDVLSRFLQERHNDRVSIRLALGELSDDWVDLEKFQSLEDELFYKICANEEQFIGLYAQCFPADAMQEFGII